MALQSKCPICQTPKLKDECFRCGVYNLDGCSLHRFTVLQENGNPAILINKRHLASFYIRQRSTVYKHYTITFDDSDCINTMEEPTVAEKGEMLLQFIAKSQQVGEAYQCDLPSDETLENIDSSQYQQYFEVLGTCAIRDKVELLYLVENYLKSAKDYLGYNGNSRGDRLGVLITPAGWAHLDEFKRNKSSYYGFIAMSFDEKFDKLHDAIKTAIANAGWKPMTLKDHPHNNNINNEIIVGIKKSRFMIAEFTGNCAGAYYEAGFAKGLGIDVVHVVKENKLKKIHFDTKQILHIRWKDEDLCDGSFVKNLALHIESTIGIGPITSGTNSI